MPSKFDKHSTYFKALVLDLESTEKLMRIDMSGNRIGTQFLRGMGIGIRKSKTAGIGIRIGSKIFRFLSLDLTLFAGII